MQRCIIPAIVLCLLAGCSASNGQPAATSVSASTVTPGTQTASTPADPTPEPTADSPTPSDSGNITKKVGQWAELQDEAGTTMVRFLVTKITVDYKCPGQYAEKSKHGRYIAVWMDIYTSRDVKLTADAVPYFNVWPPDMRIIGADGTEQNDAEGNALSCARDDDRLPGQLQGKRHVKGVVVLDSKYKHGTIALVQDYMDAGWEWAF